MGVTGQAEAAPAARTSPAIRLNRALVAAASSECAVAEQYRALCARIAHADQGAASSIVLITSPGAREGKSLTAANLALTMAREFHPSAITLDIFLPDMQGWRILDRMKADSATRHMPICVVSTDDARERAVKSGAIGFIAKPLSVGQVLGQLQRTLAANAHRYTDRRFDRAAQALGGGGR